MNAYELGREVAFKMKLLASDFHHGMGVLIAHEDGTTLFFRSAFAVEWRRNYLLVLSEHNGYHVFHKGDLRDWANFTAAHKMPRVDDEGRYVKELACPKCGTTFPIDKVETIQEVHGHDPLGNVRLLERLKSGELTVEDASRQLEIWWTATCDPDQWTEVCPACYDKWEKEQEDHDRPLPMEELG